MMIELQNRHYTIQEIGKIINGGESIRLSAELVTAVSNGRKFLDEFVAKADKPIYGINTGFGSLCDVVISPDQLGQLQENLVKSHACGMGDEVSPEIVQYMLLLKVLGLSKGNSGIQLQTIEMLVSLYNHKIIPVVYQQGSLGASGDLAPLAHLSLPLLGLGEVWFDGVRVPSGLALEQCGLSPISLSSKEGLALLNGTQFMSAHGTYMLYQLQHWLEKGDTVAAMALDAFDGRPEPFEDAVHAVRPHSGQRQTAATMRKLLAGSEWIDQNKEHVQDPYSFRCIPQVHGASKDAIAHITTVFETEINAVTDNPTLIPEEGKIISAGNFHGQPLAINLDYLAIALAELASISERRVYKLMGGQRGLPAYLVAEPGLNSGLMIAQYTAAGLVSQNKQYCTPSSVDTIDSSNGQEDHVSMGANAATKALRVFENYKSVVGIELLAAAQAVDLRQGKSSDAIMKMHRSFRQIVPFMQNDRVLHDDMVAAATFLGNH